MKVKRSDRLFIVGQTGSGKSYLARELLNRTDYVVVVDPKHMFSWEAGKQYDDIYTSVKELDQHWEGPAAAIYRPSQAELYAGCNALFAWAWKQGNILVYIDEAYDLMVGGRSGYWLQKCMKQGRQKRLGIWCGSQRPAFVDLSLITEAQHFLVGFLAMPQDRKRMADVAHPSLRDAIPPEYHFWYVGPETRGHDPKLITAQDI